MIIEARKLRKRFRVRARAAGAAGAAGAGRSLRRRRWRPVTAVDDIDLTVAAGEMIAFIGPNGAGKSTTIKLLTGILAARRRRRVGAGPRSAALAPPAGLPHRHRVRAEVAALVPSAAARHL